MRPCGRAPTNKRDRVLNAEATVPKLASPGYVWQAAAPPQTRTGVAAPAAIQRAAARRRDFGDRVGGEPSEEDEEAVGRQPVARRRLLQGHERRTPSPHARAHICAGAAPGSALGLAHVCAGAAPGSSYTALLSAHRATWAHGVHGPCECGVATSSADTRADRTRPQSSMALKYSRRADGNLCQTLKSKP